MLSESTGQHTVARQTLFVWIVHLYTEVDEVMHEKECSVHKMIRQPSQIQSLTKCPFIVRAIWSWDSCNDGEIFSPYNCPWNTVMETLYVLNMYKTLL